MKKFSFEVYLQLMLFDKLPYFCNMHVENHGHISLSPFGSMFIMHCRTLVLSCLSSYLWAVRVKICGNFSQGVHDDENIIFLIFEKDQKFILETSCLVDLIVVYFRFLTYSMMVLDDPSCLNDDHRKWMKGRKR